MSTFDEIQKKRFLYLNLLYEKSSGSQSPMIDRNEIGKELGLDEDEVDNIVKYLANEHLLEDKYLSGQLHISHYGIKEIEDATKSPTHATSYFPPVINILNIENMTSGSVLNSVSAPL